MPALDIPLERSHPARHELCRAMLSAQGGVGAGCDVAVIDTGFDPDILAPLGLPRPPDITAYDFTRRQEGWREPSGHPHGSRIIADILQSAPLARIHSLRVHGAAMDADRADIVRAIEWCGTHNIRIANLSTAFFGSDCTPTAPCILCRTINSVALSSDLFVTIAAGSAYRIGQLITRGQGIAQCPAATSELGWGIASPEVVTPGAELLKHPEDGLSFTTGKFSAGVAQLRGALPGLDLFAIRRAIRRTCTPSPHVPAAIGGFGRHCFLMAWLAGAAEAAAPQGGAEAIDLGALAKPDQPGLRRALQLICAGPVSQQDWTRARAVTERVLETVSPWCAPLDRAMVEHVRAACLEALGQDEAAAASYDAADAAFVAGVAQ